MTCKWDLIRKHEIHITSGAADPPPSPSHVRADTSVLREKKTPNLYIDNEKIP